MKGYVEAQALKAFLRAIEPLASEVRLRVSPGGVSARAVDPSNVAMVVASIPRDGFEYFENFDEELVVGINVNRLLNALKHAKKKEVVEVDLNDAKISLKIGALKYTMPTIDPESIRKEPSNVKAKFTTSVTFLNAKKLKEYVNLASKISDQITFSSDEDNFYIQAEGDVEKLKVTLNRSDYELSEFECESPARSKFSVIYVKDFLKIANDTSDTVTIKIGKNMPLFLKLNLAEDKVNVEYLLAPRIDYEFEKEFEEEEEEGTEESEESEEIEEGKGMSNEEFEEEESEEAKEIAENDENKKADFW